MSVEFNPVYIQSIIKRCRQTASELDSREDYFILSLEELAFRLKEIAILYGIRIKSQTMSPKSSRAIIYKGQNYLDIAKAEQEAIAIIIAFKYITDKQLLVKENYVLK